MNRYTTTTAIFCIAAFLSQSTAEASTLIPVIDRRDHVFDDTNGILYVSTSQGAIERYDVATDSLLAPFSVSGTSFNGIDISPDDGFVIVADASQAATQGVFRRFDTSTGDRTNLFYDRAFGEGEAWDVAVTNAGHAVVTTDYNGSGWTPMRRLDLSSNEFSPQIRRVRQRTHLHRAANGSLVFYLESNISSGPVGVYDPSTEAFPSTSSIGSTNTNRLGAVNRDGSLLAIESGSALSIVDSTFDTVELLGGLTGGFGFSPVLDVLFAVDVTTDEVVAFETTSFTEVERYGIGEDVTGGSPFGNGIMSFSGDGTRLFLSTPSGVRMIEVVGVPEPSAACLLAAVLSSIVASRRHFR